MNIRDIFYSQVLPVIELLLHSDKGPSLFRDRPNIFILGPTVKELSTHALSLLNYPDSPNIDSHRGIHTVKRNHSLLAALEAENDWFNKAAHSGPCLTIIAISPDATFDCNSLKSIASFEEFSSSNIDPNLIYASIDRPNFNSVSGLCALPLQAFADIRSHAFRKSCLQSLAPHEPNLLFQQVLHPSTIISAPGEIQASISLKLSGVRPQFIWELRNVHDDYTYTDMDQFAIALYTTTIGYSEWPSTITHFRRLTPDFITDAVNDSSLIDNLLQVALGAANRTDDDYFITYKELLQSEDWISSLLSSSRNYTSRVMESKGHPVVNLGSICTSIRKSTDTDEWNADQVFVIRHGEFAGRTVDDEEIFQKARQMCYVLECEDPAFLHLVLNDEDIILQTRCHAYGSLNEPILNETKLKEIYVPWPSEDRDRQSLMHQQVELSAAVESLKDILYFAEGRINDIESTIRHKLPGKEWDLFEEFVSDINNAMAVIHQKVLTTGPLHALESISFGRNIPKALRESLAKYRTASSPLQQLRIMLRIHLFILRYDTYVLMALVRKNDPSESKNIIAKTRSKGDKTRYDLDLHNMITMNGSARFVLRKRLEHRGHHQSLACRPVIKRLLQGESKQVISDHHELRKIRIKYDAHSDLLDDKGYLVVIHRTLPLLERVWKAIRNTFECRLIHVEEIVTEGKHRRVNGKILAGPYDSDRDRWTSRVSKDTPIYSGLCYLETDGCANLLSLDPWIIVKDECLWMLEKVKDQYGFYQSPERPGKEQTMHLPNWSY